MLIASPVAAGEFTALDGGEGRYEFTRCVQPAIAVLSDADRQALARSSRLQRRRMREYNALVDNLNDYFECLRVEADTDIQTYFRAVESSFEAQQGQAMAAAEALRRGLDLAVERRVDPGLDDELLGGSGDRPASVTPPSDDQSVPNIVPPRLDSERTDDALPVVAPPDIELDDVLEIGETPIRER